MCTSITSNILSRPLIISLWAKVDFSDLSLLETGGVVKDNFKDTVHSLIAIALVSLNTSVSSLMAGHVTVDFLDSLGALSLAVSIRRQYVPVLLILQYYLSLPPSLRIPLFRKSVHVLSLLLLSVPVSFCTICPPAYSLSSSCLVGKVAVAGGASCPSIQPSNSLSNLSTSSWRSIINFFDAAWSVDYRYWWYIQLINDINRPQL